MTSPDFKGYLSNVGKGALAQAFEHDSGVEHAMREQQMSAGALERAETIAREAISARDELEDELSIARIMLADSIQKNRALCARVAQLEHWREVASEVIDAQAAAPPPPPPSSETDSAFGLTRTKEAIEKAVKDAAALPEEARKRKLKQLQAKWHPDKHEVLKEMAEEVSKMINACIDECATEPSKAEQEE